MQQEYYYQIEFSAFLMPIAALFYVQLVNLNIILFSLQLQTLIMMAQIPIKSHLLLRAVILYKTVQAQIDLMAATNAMIALLFYGAAQNSSHILPSA